MSIARFFSAWTTILALFCLPAFASSVQVKPTLVDVIAPGAASIVKLRNQGTTPETVQIRIFRWTQTNDQDTLATTQDVVASPPAVTLAPNTDYVARVVRVSKQPVVGEEAYRMLVDVLPDSARSRSGVVEFLVRQSIPVFFASPERTPPAVDWTIARRGQHLYLIAHNKGDSRLRISALSLSDAHGNKVSFGAGLVGYVLGRSTMRWVVPAGGGRLSLKAAISLSAQGNEGAIHATAAVQGAR